MDGYMAFCLVAGYWLLGTGCWLLVAGYWLLVAGCLLLVACCWLLVAGCWMLVGWFAWLRCLSCKNWLISFEFLVFSSCEFRVLVKLVNSLQIEIGN